MKDQLISNVAPQRFERPKSFCLSLTFVSLVFILSIACPCAAEFPADHPIRSAPTVSETDTARLPEATLLGSPEVRTLLGYTRRPLHLPDGHTMGLFSFSFSAPANWLFLVDCRDLSAQHYPMPNNDIGSHGAALGADGNIYVMSYGTGRAYRFDVAAETFTELPCEIPAGEYAWDAIGGNNGRIYFGTYPGAWFGEYDPVTGGWNTWPQHVPETKYVGSMAALGDGRIGFLANGPAKVKQAFDPASRNFSPWDGLEGTAPQKISPPLPTVVNPDESFETPIEVEGRWFTVSRIESRLYELSFEAPPRMLGGIKAKAETLWWLKAQPGALAGVGYFGAMFRYDLTTGVMQQGQLNNRAPGGNSIMFVETVSPTCVVGANYSQQNLFTVNPRTGETKASLAKIAKVPGEPMCAVGLNGMAYLGIYIQSVISAFDPTNPIVYGENPRELAHLGPKYQQTRPRAAVTDGKRVYMTSDGDYNLLGGALIVYDPELGEFDVYHHLIKDQNLPSLVYDPKSRLLWGGTDRWGQMKSAPPTQDTAVIYSFDTETREVVHTLKLWPGADMVTVHTVTSNGILTASHGNEVVCIDTKSREVLYRGPWPIGVGQNWRVGSDGFNYGLSQGLLYRWDSGLNTLTAVGRSKDGRYLTESESGSWVVANTTSVYQLCLE